MKNTGCLNGRSFGLILCGLMTWFSIMPTQAANVAAPAGATLKLQIERKEISKEQAELYRTSGTKISLGVYVVFSKEWETLLNNAAISFNSSNTAWAFYETEAFSNTVNSTDPSHYLQNPSDYISICAMNGLAGQPAGACTLTIQSSWYGSKQWHQFGWPTFAWGSGFNGNEIFTDQNYAEKLDDGSYRIKIYDIQFQLNPSNTNFRSLPVGFLDDFLEHEVIDKSGSNSSIFPIDGLSNQYWPSGATCPGMVYCQDWTDLKQTSYFEFIPGGLFIQNGPDVETFEPSFWS